MLRQQFPALPWRCGGAQGLRHLKFCLPPLLDRGSPVTITGCPCGATLGREARRGRQKFSSSTKAFLTWKLAVLISIMNNKQRKTLDAIFSSPIPKSLEWKKIESLFRSIGCETIERGGSRVSFKYREFKDEVWIEHRADFHRPHPGKEAFSYQIEDAKKFLTDMGFVP